MKRMLLCLLLVSSLLVGAKAQTGSIRGKVIDSITNETIPGANVWVVIGNKPVATQTDANGFYYLRGLNPGTYTIHASFIGYNEYVIKNVPVNSNKITALDNVGLNQGVDLPDVVCPFYRDKLIDPDPVDMIVRGPELMKMPESKDINLLVRALTPTAYVSEDGKNVSFRGSRYGSVKYIVDGITQIGGSTGQVPSVAIGSMMVYMGGVPAKYGDFDGGVIVIETKSYFDVEAERN